MALSNWDCLALDEGSNPTNGKIDLDGGLTLEIYKNWLYIYHPDGGVSHTIRSGSMNIGSMTIEARRGPSDGVYVVASKLTYGTKDENPTETDYSKRHFEIMVGCGIYGYSHDIEDQSDPDIADYMIYDDGSREMLWSMDAADSHNFIAENTAAVLESLNEQKPAHAPKVIDIVRENVGTCKFTGVQQEHLNFLEALWQEVAYDHSIPIDIDFSKALRFNPGDAYFAEKLGDPSILGATPVGEAETPLMSQILQLGINGTD